MGVCYLDPLFYTDELECSSERLVNGKYPEGTVCVNARCLKGGVYMPDVSTQSGKCSCSGGLCEFDGIQNCESLYHWIPVTENNRNFAENFGHNDASPTICRAKQGLTIDPEKY